MCCWLKSIITSLILLYPLLLIVAYISMTERKSIFHLYCTFFKSLKIGNSALIHNKYPFSQDVTERVKDVCFASLSGKGSLTIKLIRIFLSFFYGCVYFTSLQAHKYIWVIAYLATQGNTLVLPTKWKLWDQSGTESFYSEIQNIPRVLILLSNHQDTYSRVHPDDIVQIRPYLLKYTRLVSHSPRLARYQQLIPFWSRLKKGVNIRQLQQQEGYELLFLV